MQDLAHILFEDAQLRDEPAILSLIRQLDHAIDPAALHRNLENKLEDGKETYRILVARSGGKTIAFAELHFMHFVYEEGPRARLSVYCVDADYRNKGIGSAFLKHIEAICWQKGIRRIELSSNLRREDAHRFYEKHGYHFNSKAFHKNR